MKTIIEMIYQGFKSWKTTGIGTVGVIVWLFAYFGVAIDEQTAGAISLVLVWLFSFVSKDADVSHTQEQ